MRVDLNACWLEKKKSYFIAASPGDAAEYACQLNDKAAVLSRAVDTCNDLTDLIHSNGSGQRTINLTVNASLFSIYKTEVPQDPGCWRHYDCNQRDVQLTPMAVKYLKNILDVGIFEDRK